MRKMKLVVEVRARIDWIEPPKDTNEAAMREYANNMATKAAAQLEPVVQSMVAVLLNATDSNGGIKVMNEKSGVNLGYHTIQEARL